MDKIEIENVSNKNDNKNANKNANKIFVTEQIKNRPIDKLRLIRKTVTTATLAIIFGGLACLTFLTLLPILRDVLYPPLEAEPVVIAKEEEDILPHEFMDNIAEGDNATEYDGDKMIQVGGGTSLIPQSTGIPEGGADSITTDASKRLELDIKDYQVLYSKLNGVIQDSNKYMVKVTGIRSDRDWFDNEYENRNETSGIIIANNGIELLVLAQDSAFKDAEYIQVTSYNGKSFEATIKEKDMNTGLAILAIPLSSMDEDSKANMLVATLGSSRPSNLVGSPIIVLGNPMGSSSSVYGSITSMNNMAVMSDCNYKLLTTDIYGSTKAAGVMINTNGQVIGVISMNHASKDMPNLIVALGITELKPTIERMSNGSENTYLGINGIDVTNDISEQFDMPIGAYVTGIELNSPAMNYGIQRGDVIVKIDSEVISNYAAYSNEINSKVPDSKIEITVMRQANEEYKEILIEATVGSRTN